MNLEKSSSNNDDNDNGADDGGGSDYSIAVAPLMAMKERNVADTINVRLVISSLSKGVKRYGMFERKIFDDTNNNTILNVMNFLEKKIIRWLIDIKKGKIQEMSGQKRVTIHKQ